MAKRFYSLLFIIIGICVYSSCSKKSEISNESSNVMEENISKEDLNKIVSKKIWFGHQSVGKNILSGVEKIYKDSGLSIEIKKIEDSVDLSTPVFAHGQIGENEDPISKIDAFKLNIESGIGNNAEIAFMKLCYIDFSQYTDVSKVFNYYTSVMDSLTNSFPNTKFVHLTVPLTLHSSGIREIIKKIIGKPSGNTANNKRNDFNRMLIKRYNGDNLVFDVAKYESQYSNGSRKSYKEDGKLNYALISSYTDDGGHLNDLGQKVVATNFLKFLSKL